MNMTALRQIAREIFERTLASLDIPSVMQRKLQLEGTSLVLPDARVDLKDVERALVIAIGKAAHGMVEGMNAILPESLPRTGVVAAPTPPQVPASGLRYFVAGHPLPNAESLGAAEAILSILGAADERTLAIFLLSGGGSALSELPLANGMTLQDVRGIHQALVTCGAPIEAMNTVRKHLSAVKGGRLAVAARRAQKLTLAITDVPAGKESALASGPTVPDPTTIADTERVLKQFGLKEKFPAAMQDWLGRGLIPETPKPGDAAFANAQFCLLLGMEDLFHAAHHAAEACGFVTRCDNTTDDWPVEKAADYLLEQLEEWQRENPGERVALVADGEVSSPVTGRGIGGRNSAFVLACAQKIAGRKITVLSAGTDGIDGNSPAAGAVADGETIKRARALGLDAAASLRESDAYSFFAAIGDEIVIGPTGNNLRDLRILLSGK